MRRYHITLGSSTTAGGKVISAGSPGSINGVRIALEGDAVACPSCRSVGKIICIGPRISEAWGGKQVALENDLCMCGCTSPPKLKPSQSVRCQMLGVAVGGIEAKKSMFDAQNVEGPPVSDAGNRLRLAVAAPATNPEKVNNYFDDMYGPIHRLSIRMDTNEDLLFSLSSAECAWLDAHNRGLHNPWGLTKAGGNNLSFDSFQDATDYFENRTQWGKRLRQISNIDDFVKELLTPPKYNSVNPAYDLLLRRQLDTVVRRKAIWMQQRQGA